MAMLTTAEVAERLRISRELVTRLARQHRIGYNMGGSAGYRFNSEDVAAILAATRTPPTTRARRRRRRAA